MALAFFDTDSLLNINYVPEGGGTTVNANYIFDPGQVPEDLQAEETSDGHWRVVVSLGQCPCAHHYCGDKLYGGQAIAGSPAPLYLLDLAPANFLGSWPASPSHRRHSRRKWEGAVTMLMLANITTAFQRRYEHRKMCVKITG
jgi:hypothetical protein